MKKAIYILIILLLFYNCGNDDNDVTPEEQNTKIDFTYSLNKKSSYNNELALKIESENNESVKIYKTKDGIINRFDKIIYTDENTNDFIIEANKTADTLYIYQRDNSNKVIKEAFRYVKLSEKTDVLEFVTINTNNNSVTRLNKFILHKKSSSNRVQIKDDLDDLEKEIFETGEFLSDPTNTHPITAFYKGIVSKISNVFSNEDENDIYDDDSKSTLSTILDKLDSTRKNIIGKLNKIGEFIDKSGEQIKDFTKEQIDKLIKEIDTDEITDDQIEDEFLNDCAGIENGTAFIDNCDECVEGTTGKEKCIEDCNGDFGGTAFLDNCDECVEGNTGKEKCAQTINGAYAGIAHQGSTRVASWVAIIYKNKLIGISTNATDEVLFEGTVTDSGTVSGSFPFEDANGDTFITNISGTVENGQMSGTWADDEDSGTWSGNIVNSDHNGLYSGNISGSNLTWLAAVYNNLLIGIPIENTTDKVILQGSVTNSGIVSGSFPLKDNNGDTFTTNISGNIEANKMSGIWEDDEDSGTWSGNKL